MGKDYCFTERGDAYPQNLEYATLNAPIGRVVVSSVGYYDKDHWLVLMKRTLPEINFSPQYIVGG